MGVLRQQRSCKTLCTGEGSSSPATAAPPDEVVASAILPVEIRGALRRRATENVIESQRLPAALQQLDSDRAQWNLLAVSTEILERAEQIIASHAVRTLDAIHIASAQEFAGRLRTRVPFISADHRQCEAAAAAGLTVRQVG